MSDDLAQSAAFPCATALTPHELGYRMPAEWETHEATWLSWPHREASWPGKLHQILPRYADMVATLSRHEYVHVNVLDDVMEARARALLRDANAELANVQFHLIATNDAWCRDHGAIFVVRAGEQPLAATHWGYNAWGGKYPPFDLDAQVPRQMADYLRVPRFEGGMILEGGSIDVNGAGLLLTSEACLLNTNRNPTLQREQIEERLCAFLGVRKVLWLGDGIVGDDTDGHIDDLTRFVSVDTVVTALESNEADDNYTILQTNLARLREMTDERGAGLQIITLPMPPVIEYEGQRLPASYANFYVANGVVLVPWYGHPNDRRATQILQDCFPDRAVVGIDCTDVIWGLGAWHCLTQQVPKVGTSR